MGMAVLAEEKKYPFCFISVHSLGLRLASGIRQAQASSVNKFLKVSQFLKVFSWRLKDPKEGTHGKVLPTRRLRREVICAGRSLVS